MDINLFSTNLLLVLGFATSSLVTFVLVKFDLRWFKRYLVMVLACGVALAYVLQIAIGDFTESADVLPSNFWLMLLPFAASLSLMATVVATAHREKKPKRVSPRYISRRRRRFVTYGASVLLVVCGFLLAGDLVNNYYRFYPNLYSVFGDEKALLTESNHLELQYSKGTPTAQVATIESSLEDHSSQTLGRVEALTIPGTVSHFAARKAWVYEPAISVKNPYVELPVVVLLSGVPGTPSDWLTAGGAQHTLDGFASHHDGITPLVFMVDDTGTFANDTECVNSPRGSVETYLTVDVPNYIRSHYPVSLDADHWAVGGLSMGGTCGIMLALRHPNVYHYFLDFGGEAGPSIGSESDTVRGLFGGSVSAYTAHQPVWLLTQSGAKRKYRDVGGFFAVGRDDTIDVTAGVRQLYNLTLKDGMDVAQETVSGGHTFGVWKQNFNDALPWLSNRLGATECTPSC